MRFTNPRFSMDGFRTMEEAINCESSTAKVQLRAILFTIEPGRHAIAINYFLTSALRRVGLANVLSMAFIVLSPVHKPNSNLAVQSNRAPPLPRDFDCDVKEQEPPNSHVAGETGLLCGSCPVQSCRTLPVVPI
jgi:hypothetical protein